MINKIYRFILVFFLLNLIRNIPGRTGFFLRKLTYNLILKKVGKNFRVGVGVYIQSPHLIEIGDNVWIDDYSLILNGDGLISKNVKFIDQEFYKSKHFIKIGNNIHICQNCILVGYGYLEINNNVAISAGSKIYTLTNLNYNPQNKKEMVINYPYEDAFFLCGPIIIEENTFISVNCSLFPGCFLGKNCFVYPYSVVNQHYENNSIIRGNPAKFIKKSL